MVGISIYVPRGCLLCNTGWCVKISACWDLLCGGAQTSAWAAPPLRPVSAARQGIVYQGGAYAHKVRARAPATDASQGTDGHQQGTPQMSVRSKWASPELGHWLASSAASTLQPEVCHHAMCTLSSVMEGALRHVAPSIGFCAQHQRWSAGCAADNVGTLPLAQAKCTCKRSST